MNRRHVTLGRLPSLEAETFWLWANPSWFTARGGDKARALLQALFSGAGDTEHMPTTELTNDDFGGGSIDVLTLLVKCGLAASKGEARRLVQQGGVTVNDEKVPAIETTFGCEQFTGDGVIIKKGKKVFHRAVLV